MAADNRICVVTLQGDLIVLQCKHSSSKGSEMVFRRTSFNQDSGTFVNNDEEVVYENVSRAVSIVCCTAAVNVKMKQKVLCVLLKFQRKGCLGFRYMLYSLSSQTRAKLLVEFSLPYEISNDVWIFWGPTLVWTHDDVVFYTSAESGNVKEVPIRLKVSFFGKLPLCQRPLVILGLQKMTEEEVGSDGEALLYFIDDGQTFSSDGLVPSAYASVVRCMLVLSAKEVQGSLRSTVVAATCRKQLVWFENGLPEEVCVLPYEEPQCIQMVHTGSGGLIMVGFNHGNVCAVWRDSFKIAACWTDVRRFLVDDFVGAGFEQMLLLFEEISEDGTLRKFLLTDLCGIHYLFGRVEQEDPKRRDVAEKNITLTIHALEARLQNGLVFLQELRRDHCVKDDVLWQCVAALRDLLSDRKHVAPSALQVGLVCLLDEQSEEDECAPYVRMETRRDERFLKLDRVWHRVIGQTLVFGALLPPTNQTMESEHIIAAVIATPTVVQCVNKVMLFPEPCLTPGPPSTKRSKVLSGPAILLATDLAPLLTFDPVKCSILMCFPNQLSGRTSSELVNVDLKGALEGMPRLVLFEDCSIDSDESRGDLLSLMAVLQPWELHIACTDRTVVDLAMFLEEKFRAKRIKVSPQYLLCGSGPLLGAVLFRWKACSAFDGTLDVYCSHHLGLLNFLDALHSFLPASHCVKLIESGQGRNRSPVLSLANEICSMKEGVAELIHSPGSDISHEQGFKENRDKLRPLVDLRLYRRMAEKAIKLKMLTDVDTLVEAELNKY